MDVRTLLSRFAYLTLIIAFAGYIYFYQHAEALIPYIFALAFIPLFEIGISSYLIILVTAILLSIIIFIPNLFIVSLPFLILLVFLNLAVSVFVGLRYTHYFFSMLIFLSALFLLHQRGVEVAVDGAEMGLLILYSGIVICIFRLVFLPINTKRSTEVLVNTAKKSLFNLLSEVFATFSPQYPRNRYQAEKKIHDAKINYILVCDNLRHQSYKNRKILKKLDDVFEIINDCALLRWRIKDFNTFELCKEELKNILNQLKEMLTVSKDFDKSVDEYYRSIDRFETNYQNVLQITERNPIIFLLFINTLKELAHATSQVSANK